MDSLCILGLDDSDELFLCVVRSWVWSEAEDLCSLITQIIDKTTLTSIDCHSAVTCAEGSTLGILSYNLEGRHTSEGIL